MLPEPPTPLVTIPPVDEVVVALPPVAALVFPEPPVPVFVFVSVLVLVGASVLPPLSHPKASTKADANTVAPSPLKRIIVITINLPRKE